MRAPEMNARHGSLAASVPVRQWKKLDVKFYVTRGFGNRSNSNTTGVVDLEHEHTAPR
jgi:hypothetical protein